MGFEYSRGKYTHRGVHLHLVGSAESMRVSGSRRHVKIRRMLVILVLAAVWLQLVSLLKRMAWRRRPIWSGARIEARVSARIARVHTVATAVCAGLLEYGINVKQEAQGDA
jgi:hypothetical protein